MWLVVGCLPCFAEQWDTTSPGYYLDLPNPCRGYVVFAVIAVIVLPYVALVRKMSARRTRLEYWTFVIPTAFVCLFLICMVTIPFCYTIKWMDAAGRGPGEMVVGLGGYIIVLGFFFWAIKTPKGKKELEKAEEERRKKEGKKRKERLDPGSSPG